MTGGARGDYEVSILARLLAKDEEELPAEMARYLLGLGFNRRDKERMHELAVRNQDGALSKDERDELIAYAKTGSVLSILKSKARRILKNKPTNL
jgi:hypothetical protein